MSWYDPRKNDNVTFYDGIIKIICGVDAGASIKEIFLNGEFDEPLSLNRIKAENEDVRMVIYEEGLVGYIYKFNNHGNNKWELAGRTKGYA